MGIEHVSSCAQQVGGGASGEGNANRHAVFDPVRKCLVKAAFTHCARQQEGATAAGGAGAKGQGKGGAGAQHGSSFSYQTIVDRQSDCRIHPSSVLFARKPQPSVVVFGELVSTNKNFLRYVTSVEPQWLIELCPQMFAAAGGGGVNGGAGK